MQRYEMSIKPAAVMVQYLDDFTWYCLSLLGKTAAEMQDLLHCSSGCTHHSAFVQNREAVMKLVLMLTDQACVNYTASQSLALWGAFLTWSVLKHWSSQSDETSRWVTVW